MGREPFRNANTLNTRHSFPPRLLPDGKSRRDWTPGGGVTTDPRISHPFGREKTVSRPLTSQPEKPDLPEAEAQAGAPRANGPPGPRCPHQGHRQSSPSAPQLGVRRFVVPPPTRLIVCEGRTRQHGGASPRSPTPKAQGQRSRRLELTGGFHRLSRETVKKG